MKKHSLHPLLIFLAAFLVSWPALWLIFRHWGAPWGALIGSFLLIDVLDSVTLPSFSLPVRQKSPTIDDKARSARMVAEAREAAQAKETPKADEFAFYVKSSAATNLKADPAPKPWKEHEKKGLK